MVPEDLVATTSSRRTSRPVRRLPVRMRDPPLKPAVTANNAPENVMPNYDVGRPNTVFSEGIAPTPTLLTDAASLVIGLAISGTFPTSANASVYLMTIILMMISMFKSTMSLAHDGC